MKLNFIYLYLLVCRSLIRQSSWVMPLEVVSLESLESPLSKWTFLLAVLLVVGLQVEVVSTNRSSSILMVTGGFSIGMVTLAGSTCLLCECPLCNFKSFTKRLGWKEGRRFLSILPGKGSSLCKCLPALSWYKLEYNYY